MDDSHVHERLATLDRRLDQVFAAIESLPDRIYQRLHAANDRVATPNTITLTIDEFTQALMQASKTGAENKTATTLVEQRIRTTLHKDVSITRGSSPVHVDTMFMVSPAASETDDAPSPSNFDMLLDAPRQSRDAQYRELISATGTLSKTEQSRPPSHSLQHILSNDVTPSGHLKEPISPASPSSPSSQRKKRKIRAPRPSAVHEPFLVTSTSCNVNCGPELDGDSAVPALKKPSRRHAPPPHWRCRATLSKTLWIHWYRGDPANRVGPLRLLKVSSSSTIDEQSKQMYRRGRRLMRALEHVIQTHAWIESVDAIAALPTAAFLDLFERAFGALLGKTSHGTLARPGFEKVRAEQAAYYMFSTVVDMLGDDGDCSQLDRTSPNVSTVSY